MGRVLARLLPLVLLAVGCSAVDSRFPAVDSADAWKRMPRDTPPLPLWARTLVDSLPGTTALQVDLDYLHRKRNPLGPVLAARIRRAVAEENRCDYARESADFDLAQAKPPAEPPTEAEQLAIGFARKLTVDGAAITDEEVAALVEAVGLDDTVAVVHTAALANFQNRIYLALGLTSEPGGAAPPREVLPAADAAFPVPARTGPKEVTAGESGALPPWDERTAAELRDLLEQQKGRESRIPMPDEVRRARLSRPERARKPRVSWGRVSMGYQPVLTTAWFRTMAAFDKEAKLDQAFNSTIFWVITRTVDCFY
jgi:hypothetical protein